MKVIGSTKEGYIVVASSYELVALAGKPINERDIKGYGSTNDIAIGTEFVINKAWEQIHRNDKRKAEVLTVRKQLEAVITQLDMIEPFLDEPKPEEAAAVEG